MNTHSDRDRRIRRRGRRGWVLRAAWLARGLTLSTTVERFDLSALDRDLARRAAVILSGGLAQLEDMREAYRSDRYPPEYAAHERAFRTLRSIARDYGVDPLEQRARRARQERAS